MCNPLCVFAGKHPAFTVMSCIQATSSNDVTLIQNHNLNLVNDLFTTFQANI